MLCLKAKTLTNKDKARYLRALLLLGHDRLIGGMTTSLSAPVVNQKPSLAVVPIKQQPQYRPTVTSGAGGLQNLMGGMKA